MVPMQKTGELKDRTRRYWDRFRNFQPGTSCFCSWMMLLWCCWRQQEFFEILYFLRMACFFGSDTKSIQQYKTRDDVIISYLIPNPKKLSYEVIILRMMLLTVDLDLFSWWLFNGLYHGIHHHQTTICDHLTLKQIPSWCDEFENDTPSRKLTWQWKINPLKRYLQWQWFHCQC